MLVKMRVIKAGKHDVYLTPLDGDRTERRIVAHRAWVKGTWIKDNEPLPAPNPGEVWEVETQHFGLDKYSGKELYIAKPVQFLSLDWRRYARILPDLS